jgi:hypothetical protein
MPRRGAIKIGREVDHFITRGSHVNCRAIWASIEVGNCNRQRLTGFWTVALQTQAAN